MQKQVVALTLFLSAMLPLKVAAKTYSELYIFGDSLSDTGNLYKITKDQFPPSPPYFNGRFSNGPVWVETLGSQLKIPATATKNYAIGGATSTKTNSLNQLLGVQLPSFPSQIDTFSSTVKNPNRNALYVVWVGANDYLVLPQKLRTQNTQAVVNRISNGVRKLIAQGAREIVVVNLPNLGRIPQERSLGTTATLAATTNNHNRNLRKSLHLVQQNRQVRITLLDVDTIFNKITAKPARYGFTNVSERCSGNSKCTNPNQFLFWDDIHPSARAHKLIADYATSVINPPTVRQADISLNAGAFVSSERQPLAFNYANIFPNLLTLSRNHAYKMPVTWTTASHVKSK